MYKDNKLKNETDTDNVVELMYDSPKPQDNSFGLSWLYGVRKDGSDQDNVIFASKALHGKLESYGRGDKVNIRKEDIGDGRVAWNVILKSKASSKNSSSSIDDRTHDIHKQVCLKLAVDMMPKNGEVLTGGELVVVEANMKSLLRVLEGEEVEQSEDTPF